ncbi:hypothetical protein PLEOSDRAFT_1038450 [Pleurotus ostreatus PC15]|uniref:Cytochrome c oxidase assembly factor 3 n=2 Tax=Pleurotus TaxID=5320 RepID=A0A067NRK6_PLEO1|nr:hypothetical protein CCMSSC00406_0001172 [Pleurotus cornucopiae]KDQ29645.1 hypothetical protein PLEOSDRAFT_1038450 [Pleurotus ostreatus PC15]
MEPKRYVDRKAASQSYRPKSNLMSPGLKRAREPFKYRNAFTGLVLGGFVVGVWAYSISAVKQDVFDDIDEEAREMAKPAGNATAATADVEKSLPTPSVPTIITAPQVPLPDVRSGAPPRGILAKFLEARYPAVLDPKQKTVVWGAPSVDAPGRIQKS